MKTQHKKTTFHSPQRGDTSITAGKAKPQPTDTPAQAHPRVRPDDPPARATLAVARALHCLASSITRLEDWLDAQDVMQALHISPRTLQTLRTKKILPYAKLRGKIYYKKQDIEKILNQNYSQNR